MELLLEFWKNSKVILFLWSENYQLIFQGQGQLNLTLAWYTHRQGVVGTQWVEVEVMCSFIFTIFFFRSNNMSHWGKIKSEAVIAEALCSKNFKFFKNSDGILTRTFEEFWLKKPNDFDFFFFKIIQEFCCCLFLWQNEILKKLLSAPFVSFCCMYFIFVIY